MSPRPFGFLVLYDFSAYFGGFLASFHSQFGEYGGNMVIDSTDGQDQSLGDLGIRESLSYKAQHLGLAIRQAQDVVPGPGLTPRGMRRTPMSLSRTRVKCAAGRARSRSNISRRG